MPVSITIDTRDDLLRLGSNLFPHVESLLMDGDTLHDHRTVAGTGNGTTPAPPGNLTPSELSAFERCAGENLRLEQERIPQSVVESRIAKLELRPGSGR